MQGVKVRDAGGELLRKLTERNIDWFTLLRSNKKNLHPLWFGIYGNLIYHHGGGFRDTICQLDKKAFPFKYIKILANYNTDSQSLSDKGIRLVGRTFRKIWFRKMSNFNNKFYSEIRKNENFYLRLFPASKDAVRRVHKKKILTRL